MGFNGSGTFSRLYSWVSDAASAIAISSSRMDADSNDIATGLSNVICKDGQTTTTAAISFAQGVQVSDGTVGAPSVTFTSDTDSGLYHIAANEIGVGVNGAKVLDVSTTGLSVTGTLSTTGNASVTGNVSATGNLSGVNLTLTGTATIPNLSNVTNDMQTKAAVVPNTAPAAGQILVGNAGATAYAPVSASGDATISSAGAITVSKTGGVAFGTAATKNVGTSANNVVQLDASAKLPAVDGSALLNITIPPTTSTLPVGFCGMMVNQSGVSIADGGNVAGSSIKHETTQNAPTLASFPTQTGTWKSVAGYACGNNIAGLFVRIS